MAMIAVFLAEGFEEVEALSVIDVCKRAGLHVMTVSITKDKVVTGSHKIPVMADMVISELDFDLVDMIFLPGGMPGTVNLENCSYLMQKVKQFDAERKFLCAICAAPTIFGHMGLLKGRNACCYPGMEDQLIQAQVSMNPVEVSDHITTSRGMGTAIELGLSIVEQFQGRLKSDKLAEAIVYQKIRKEE